VPIVQTGTTKRITTQDIANLGNASGVEGSGTINYLAMFTASSTIGNSILSQSGVNIILNGKYFVATDTVFTGYFGKSSELISSTSASDLGIFSPNGINFGTGSSNLLRMRITLDGNVAIGTSTPLGILHLYKAGATTRMVIDGDAAQSRIITYRTGGVQRFGLYVNNTAESGSNVGSDFQIRAYSDAGTLLSTPLFIKRSTGAATFAGGLGLSGATAGTSGIQFPATQVASANNNNLDDYEEGTWTMGLSFGGASVGVTYSNNSGVYTKVGRQVTVTGYLTLTNKGTSTGAAKITGLPFTTLASLPHLSAGSISFSNITYAGQVFCTTDTNKTTLDLAQTTNLGVASFITDVNFTNSSTIVVTITYFV
jgi:hypothetical protein